MIKGKNKDVGYVPFDELYVRILRNVSRRLAVVPVFLFLFHVFLFHARDLSFHALVFRVLTSLFLYRVPFVFLFLSLLETASPYKQEITLL